uniref:Selenoprotein H n=1 Tax=Arundo donax TaxID=35708 RepID=A0A0A9BDG6_ARUDO
MPPKRKSPAAAVPALGSPRKTRSMAAAGKRGTEASPAKAAAPAKKEAAAAAERKGRKRAPKKEEKVTAATEPKGRKRAKKDAEAPPAVAAAEDGGDVAGQGKRVVVEACTQCRQFKIRAQKVKEDLESSVPGVSVIINPEKPRRGCLEIREEGGEVFISLLNMPRPFTAMKKLDMDEVIRDIAEKIS